MLDVEVQTVAIKSMQKVDNISDLSSLQSVDGFQTAQGGSVNNCAAFDFS